ncbi:MAG: hypothetical protein V1722_01455 [Candidatus Micrarchaeota archaeon]
MSEERHFSPEHAETLKGIFVRLSDFMHEKGIEQIAGIGPTATPFVRAIAVPQLIYTLTGQIIGESYGCFWHC